MKYLAIDYSGIKALIDSRQLQGVDFKLAEKFISAVRGKKSDQIGVIQTFSNPNGLLITSIKSIDKKKVLIFDVGLTNLLSLTNNELLSVIQKTARLAIKIWGEIPLSSSETRLDESNFIVFPFPYCTDKPKKVFIRTNINEKRQKLRDQEFLYSYEISSNYVDIEEKISETIFHKFNDDIQALIFPIARDSSNQVRGYIEQSSLSELPVSFQIDSLGYSEWLEYLTATQYEFCTNDYLGPTRLEGAAGTGKTLSLVIKAISIIQKRAMDDFKLLFVTHSISAKKKVESSIKSICPEISLNSLDTSPSITVSTLNEICLSHLSNDIKEDDFLDLDAQESKSTQLLYILECLSEFVEKDFSTYEPLLSPEFKSLLNGFSSREKEFEIAEMFQIEISSIIKGQANDDRDVYFSIERPPYALPAKSGDFIDLTAIYHIYNKYKGKLSVINQYDTDDITISCLKKMDSPIWNRRRLQNGYSCLIIDEAHLFNINELSVFHFLLSEPTSNSLIYAVDQVQSITDLGLGTSYISKALKIDPEKKLLGSVFRCSEAIINLSEHVVASGAMLFSDFPQHSLVDASFTNEEEMRCKYPCYTTVVIKEKMPEEAFAQAESLVDKYGYKKYEILFCCVDDEILNMVNLYAESRHKSYEILRAKADFDAISKSKKDNKFILSHIDNLVGTEFCVVIIIGADSGRFPRLSRNQCETSHFQHYRAHNRLYIAISRAKFSVSFISEASRGATDVIHSAIDKNLINFIPSIIQ